MTKTTGTHDALRAFRRHTELEAGLRTTVLGILDREKGALSAKLYDTYKGVINGPYFVRGFALLYEHNVMDIKIGALQEMLAETDTADHPLSGYSYAKLAYQMGLGGLKASDNLPSLREYPNPYLIALLQLEGMSEGTAKNLLGALQAAGLLERSEIYPGASSYVLYPTRDFYDVAEMVTSPPPPVTCIPQDTETSAKPGLLTMMAALVLFLGVASTVQAKPTLTFWKDGTFTQMAVETPRPTSLWNFGNSSTTGVQGKALRFVSAQDSLDVLRKLGGMAPVPVETGGTKSH